MIKLLKKKSNGLLKNKLDRSMLTLIMKIIKLSMRKMKKTWKILKTIYKKILMAKTKKKIIWITRMKLRELKRRKRKQKRLTMITEMVV